MGDLHMTKPARAHERRISGHDLCGMAPQHAWKKRRYFQDEMIIGMGEPDQTRLLTDLAPGIVHDIRNMLNVILNRVYLARRSEQPDIPDILAAIEAAARSASGLADNIMKAAGSKFRSTVDDAVLNLNVCLVAMLPMLERSLSGVTLRLCLATSNLWPVKANSAEFDAAILNLVMNACDALQTRGNPDATITIRTANISDGLNGVSAKDRVLVSVADNGPGMDA
ncbi:MAG TPA: hypothetical protein VHO91_13970, partial [Rhodopila sp.]|nr:hypothetical protein [Rhodopila sp.]